MKRFVIVACLLAGQVAGVTAQNAPPLLSAEDRAELAREFVRKWGGYVERVYQVPAETWAERMASTFGSADPANLRDALARETFEGALAELIGRGHRLPDAKVFDAFSAPAALTDAGQAGIGSSLLGDTTRDLVYTPVQPCRILDTRVVGGAIAASSTRSFLAVAANAGVDFTSQGGSNTNCDVADVGASAVAINLTAVTPSNGGYTTVYPYGTAMPLAATVNYAAGAIVNNTVIVRVPNPLTIRDFTVFTLAQAHYVADIVGYFSPPQATPFACVNTSVSTFTIAASSTNFFNNPACPAGYTVTTPYCWTSASGVYSQGQGHNANAAGNPTFCAWQNTTGASQTVFGGNVCCRIPGR